jgi:RanBP-type and C3HC4-type zinc finger-containing protein 1
VPNTEPFECPICFTPCSTGDGIVLRDCLHIFCFDCIRAHILQNINELKIKCPHMSNDFSCDSFLQDRELRSFLEPDEYQKFLNRSLQAAESTIKNSVHCLTADCPGWCIKEGINLVEFTCPVCYKTNCLNCNAIHESRTCDEYLQSITKYTVTQADRMSKLEIDRLLVENKAMLCPGCEALIEKISGCDGMFCSNCKTELCWATKGARRGPNGCKCGENGQMCHPNCHNCH